MTCWFPCVMSKAFRFTAHTILIVACSYGGCYRYFVLVLRYRAGLRHPRYRLQPNMARAQGINTNFNIVLGLMLSNGWWRSPVRCWPVPGLC